MASDVLKWEDIVSKDGMYITSVIPSTSAATATNYGVFFTARWSTEVQAIIETHDVAGSDLGAVTLQVERLKPGVAPGAGEVLLTTAFDLKSTANTPVTKSKFDFSRTRSTVDGLLPRQLEPGDRLALRTSGTLTAVDQVSVTLYITHIGKGDYR